MDDKLSYESIGFNFDILCFNDLSGHFDALLELRDMEDIMNGGQLRRKTNPVSNWSTSFDDYLKTSQIKLFKKTAEKM